MIRIVVVADIDWVDTLEQCTIVPFKLMLTESIDNVVIRDEAPGAEVLVKVNVEQFTIIVRGI